MKRTISATPHDKFFQFAFKHVSLVRGLTQMTFTSSLIEQLNLDDIKLESGTWVSNKLREKRADLLFSIPVLPKNSTGTSEAKNVLLHLLLEHKSTSDHYTVLQVLTYLVQIWEEQRRNSIQLTPIFTLVIFHGAMPWNAPTQFRELLGIEFAPSDFQLDFEIKILDLTTWPDNYSASDPILTSTLQLLKYSRSPSLSDLLFDILNRIRVSALHHTLEDWFQACWTYVMTTNPYLTNSRIQEIVEELLSVEFEPGSAADQLYRKGHKEGMAEGLAEGLAEGHSAGLIYGTNKGIVIGRIQLLQQLLGVEVTARDELIHLDIQQLNELAISLEQRQKEK